MAKNLFSAIKEAGELTNDDENIYYVILYEKIGKNFFKQIMRSDNGYAFYPEERDSWLERKVQRLSGKIEEWFEVRLSYIK